MAQVESFEQTKIEVDNLVTLAHQPDLLDPFTLQPKLASVSGAAIPARGGNSVIFTEL